MALICKGLMRTTYGIDGLKLACLLDLIMEK